MKRRRDMLTYAKYPFIVDFKSYVQKVYGYEASLSELAADKTLAKLARTRLELAAKGDGLPAAISPTTEEEVLSFYLALAAAAALKSRRLLDALADAEARRVRALLDGEDQDSLLALASALKVTARASTARILVARSRSGRAIYKALPYSVKLGDYLKIIAGLDDPSWSLVNSMVDAGWVYLDENRFKDLLSIASRKVILELASRLAEEGAAVESLAVDAARLVELKSAGLRPVEEIDESLLPPCMAELAKDPASKGDEGLYAYLSFLAAVGASADTLAKVLAAARRVDDLEAARALVEAMLKQGLGTTYAPYTCEAMRKRGLCVAQCGVRTPVQMFLKLRRGRARNVEKGVGEPAKS